MSPSDLEGKTYGPVSWRIAAGAVADFVSLTGDDPQRWSDTAPPGFAAAALFAVAPDLLAELYDSSVIHGEQTFSWKRALVVGAQLDIAGTVSRVRERGGVSFVTFDVTAADGPDPVLTGKSLFLVSGESLAAQSEFTRPEPHHSYTGDPGDGEMSASRADLVRYASATRDWNPVHWDHEAGIAAGFPGVVVHGLLQAGWALRAAGTESGSLRPFSSAKFRFRHPLLPARPVQARVERGDRSLEVVLSDADVEYLSATIVPTDE